MEGFWGYFGGILFETKRRVCQSDSAIVRRKTDGSSEGQTLGASVKNLTKKSLYGAFVSLTAR